MLAPANPATTPLNALQQHYQRQQQWQAQWQAPSTSPAKSQIIVLTGDGFGKSNTAFGMGMAVLAQNRPLAVIQFLETSPSHPARPKLPPLFLPSGQPANNQSATQPQGNRTMDVISLSQPEPVGTPPSARRVWPGQS